MEYKQNEKLRAIPSKKKDTEEEEEEKEEEEDNNSESQNNIQEEIKLNPQERYRIIFENADKNRKTKTLIRDDDNVKEDILNLYI